MKVLVAYSQSYRKTITVVSFSSFTGDCRRLQRCYHSQRVDDPTILSILSSFIYHGFQKGLMLPVSEHDSSMEPVSQELHLGAELPAPTVPRSRRSCRPAMKRRFQLPASGQGSVQAWGEGQHLLASDLLFFLRASFARNLATVLHFDLPVARGFCPEPVLSLPIF